MLRALGDEAVRGESVVRSVVGATRAGRDFGPTELLALQAEVYRYSEAIDLAAKLVDRASTAVKTVISGQ
jgi:type III secretion system YscI/HrpB-like protein